MFSGEFMSQHNPSYVKLLRAEEGNLTTRGWHR